MSDDDEVLKVADVAALLKCNRNTVYVMVQRKLIPHRHIGTGKRALRFSKKAILEWLRSSQDSSSKKDK